MSGLFVGAASAANSGLKALPQFRALLPVIAPAVANPTAIFDALRVMMRPVNEATEVIPLIHAANAHPVAHTQRDTFRKIDIVCNEKRSAIADLDDEPLMARTVIVIGQQAPDEARDLDPLTVIALGKRLIQ